MIKVMHAYVDAMDFTSLTLDDAIRKFLEGFGCRESRKKSIV